MIVLALAYLGVVSPMLIRTDLREHRLPNRIVLPGIAVGLVVCAGEWITSGHPPVVSMIAALVYPGFLLAHGDG
jgi:leader peptidase (prepilin peptidase)/N-methyltransferase